MCLLRLVRAGLLLASVLGHGVLGYQGASAQQGTDSKLKEVQLGNDSFTVSDPIPFWVDQLPIPETASSQPVVIRLADTQHFLGKSLPELHVRRAILVNDPAALTAAGRFSISFSPEYERVKLHAIRIHRGQEKFDRTPVSNIRFTQRAHDRDRLDDVRQEPGLSGQGFRSVAMGTGCADSAPTDGAELPDRTTGRLAH